MTEILTRKIYFNTRKPENDNLNNTYIEMEKRKNKTRKNIKIKSYCGKCFQYFENGPFSQKCRKHLKKKCNVVSCQKRKKGNNECIRLFPNKNSANRHTHCITKDDIKLWDKQYEIQTCLGRKRSNENKFFEVSLKENIFNNNQNDGFDFFNDSNHFTSSNVGGIIERFDQLNVDDSFEINKIFPSIQYENNNHYNNNNNDNNNNMNMNNINNDHNIIMNNNNNNLIHKEKSVKNLKGSMNFSIMENKKIPNEETIDNFFELVQKETFISNSIKKKLVKAFKKIGILNIKILKLFHEKYKGWDFLIQKFKDIFPEIEGVSLCIEYLLK